MDSTESVAGLVRDDLPLARALSADDDVSARDSLVASGARAARTAGVGRHCSLHAGLTQPCETDGRARIASAEQSPVTIAILLVATPTRKEVEAVLDIDAIAACLIPLGSRGRCAGT